MHNVALDEQRHIGFGVKLLRDLAREDPDVPAAVGALLREVLPYALAVFVPPGWDRRYTECFGFTLEEIYEDAARSLESKLRAAGLADRDAARCRSRGRTTCRRPSARGAGSRCSRAG